MLEPVAQFGTAGLRGIMAQTPPVGHVRPLQFGFEKSRYAVRNLCIRQNARRQVDGCQLGRICRPFNSQLRKGNYERTLSIGCVMVGNWLALDVGKNPRERGPNKGAIKCPKCVN
jgi:hypothetical protein